VFDLKNKYPLIRIFISSTFDDFQDERNILHNNVFPVLRTYCLEHEARFLPIDLRWGISAQASNDQYIVRPCLEEVKRCQKASLFFSFLALLGDRYGSRLLPESIVQTDFDALLLGLSREEQDLAHKWYRLDQNMLPASFALRPRDPTWDSDSPILQAALLKAVQKTTIGPMTRLRLTKSITEQEIDSGIFQSNRRDAAVIFRRHITTPDVPEYFGTASPEDRDLLTDLHHRLSAHNAAAFHHYDATLAYDATSEREHISPTSLHDFQRMAQTVLTQRIDAALKLFHEQQEDQTGTFIADQLAYYQPQIEPHQQITNYLAQPAQTPLIITGESGIGKTTLLAQAARDVRDRNPIEYFIGGSTTIANIPDLLTDIEITLAKRYRANVAEIPSGRIKLAYHLTKLLKLATAKNPLIIFIDALDQLSKEKEESLISWIPISLPPHVHFIISLLPGSDLDALRQRSSAINVVEVVGLPDTEAKQLFNAWLAKQNRTVTLAQLSLVLDYYKKHRNPLALRVIVEFALQWASDDTPLPFMQTTIEELIDDWLKSLEDPRRHGPLLPPYLLGLIGAGKNGLTEDELLAIMSEHPDLVHEITNIHEFIPVTKLFPPVLWARLYAEIDWMLAEKQIDNARVFNFYHRQFQEAIERKVISQYHRDLAQHFSLRADHRPYITNTHEQPRAVVNERMVSELAYQYKKGGQPAELRRLLFDAEFIQARIQSGGTRAALVDIDYIPPDPQIHLLRATLAISQPILDDAPEELRNQIFGRSTELFHLMGESWAEWYDPHFVLESPTLSQAGQLPETQSRHQNAVNACGFNHDGTLVVSASKDRTVRVWNVQTGVCLAVLQGHTDNVRTCAFSPVSNIMVSGSDDTTVKLWEPQLGTSQSWELMQTFHEHKGNVRWCTFSPDGRYVASAAEDAMVWIWDTHTDAKYPLAGHTDTVNKCVFSHNGRLIASVSSDGTARIWDWSAGTPPLILKRHKKAVLSCVFHADDAKLVTASADMTLRVWDVATGKCLHTLKGHKNRINDCAFNPQEKDVLVSASEDKTLRVWNVKTGKLVKPLNDYSGAIRACCFSSDGKFVLGANWGNVLLVWEWKTATLRKKLTGHTAGLNACAIAPDGLLAISGSEDCTIAVWDLTRMERSLVLGGAKHLIRSCAVSADGRQVISGSTDGTITLEDIETQHSHPWPSHDHWVRSCAFSPDGQYLLSASDDKTLRLWVKAQDAAHPYVLMKKFTDSTETLRFCTFSPDGRYFLSAGGEGENDTVIRIWDATNQKLIKKLTGHEGVVIDGRFSPDGETIYSVSFDQTIRRWNNWQKPRHSSKIIASKKSIGSVIRTCDMSPDGNYLVFGCSDGQIGVIDLRSKRKIHHFKVHDDLVNTCRFIPKYPYVVTGSSDHRVKVWNVETQQCFVSWRGDDRTIICLDADRNNRRIFAAEDDALHILSLVNLPLSSPPTIAL
jgi:WD40 repeat protein